MSEKCPACNRDPDNYIHFGWFLTTIAVFLVVCFALGSAFSIDDSSIEILELRLEHQQEIHELQLKAARAD